MRTVIAPPDSRVEEEIAALDRRRAEIARRFIRRLALEPTVGTRIPHGVLAQYGCRRIYFDRGSRPDDLFGGAGRPQARRGNQPLDEGPAWRIVYWTREMSHLNIRLIVILAVGRGHTQPTEPDAYQRAAKRLRPFIRALEKKGETR